jgi:hypothetical protein
MSEWRENSNGNYVYVLDSDEVMTVYERNGEWFGVYDDQFTEEGFKDPEEAMTLMEKAVLDGNLDLLSRRMPEPKGWRKTQKGGYHRRGHSFVLTVNQAKSKKWYLVVDQTLLKDLWFASAEEAMRHGDLL